MEFEILQMLQATPGTRFSYKEIGRRLDRKQFRENASWARPFLERMTVEGSIEKMDNLYFFPELDEEEEDVKELGRINKT